MKAEMEEEERIASEKDEENVAVIEESDDVQAIIDANRQLTKQLQTQEREQLSIEERSKLLAELIESRRKYFAAKRVKEIRNKPPTKAQQKSLMYIDTEIVEERLKKTQAEVTEGGSKRAAGTVEEESAKKQRLEKEDDTTELKRCIEIVPKDDNESSTLPSKVSPFVAVVALHIELIKSNGLISIDSQLSSSFLQEPSCPHSQHGHLPSQIHLFKVIWMNLFHVLISEEAEAVRKVHATHARIVTKSVLESAKEKSSGKISKSLVIQDTPSAPKSKPATLKSMLKGVPTLTLEEQGATDIMQAPKESKKDKQETESEGIGVKLGVLNEEKDIAEEKDDKDGDADDEGDDHISDTQDADDEDDQEMIDAKVDDSKKGDEEVTNAIKAYVEKTLKVKDDPKKTKLLPTSSNLSVSSGFEESPSTATAITLPPLSVSTTLFVPQQTTTPIPTHLITTDAPTITTAVSKSNALSTIKLRVEKLEKDVSKLKIIDHSTEALAILNDKEALEEYDMKSALYLSINANKSFNKNLANHLLYHALLEALIGDKNVMDKGVIDTVKDHKRKHNDDEDNDEDPAAGPNQGKAPTKGSKTGKSAFAKEPVEELNVEVVMDDAGDDVAHNDNQPQDASKPKTTKTPNPYFRIDSKSINKVSVLVVLDLSKVANLLYSLRDKDLFKSKDPQVVVTATKLPILNLNEFDLWKMRIEQYFLMTDYSLWEVILNGDSPTLTEIVDSVVKVIAPTTIEQRLAKKNEFKARGALLMVLLDKHQLKLNIYKDAKSLMEAIRKRLGGYKKTKKV
uniref:Uncharacterized protein n=1 Tax=Tanacetum cinerariifolium TaxID=118510 RepID=A0A6L2KBR9_TANCI|nr:hypothetical protein [Tanacetum cinerariifolium]